MRHLKCSTRTVPWNSTMPILTNDNVRLRMPVPNDGPSLLLESETSIPYSAIAHQRWTVLPLTSLSPNVSQPFVGPSQAL